MATLTWPQVLSWRLRRHCLDPVGGLGVKLWEQVPRKALSASAERLGFVVKR